MHRKARRFESGGLLRLERREVEKRVCTNERQAAHGFRRLSWLCDKVAIIKDGKLVKSGTMEEIKGDASLETVFLELEGDVCD